MGTPTVGIVIACIVLAGHFGQSAAAPILGRPASRRTIAIQPFAGIPAEHVAEAERALTAYYKCAVRVLPEIALPREAFTEVKTPRYRADKLLDFLRGRLPEGCDHVIGLTASDISTTKYEDWATRKIKQPEWKYEDWGIFGLGEMPGKACIVSTFRLKGGVGEEKLRERLRKICCHEVGHNLGLPHCSKSEECFMRDGAEKIATVDAESETLCEHCAKRVGIDP
jgi:archaemetzincin